MSKQIKGTFRVLGYHGPFKDCRAMEERTNQFPSWHATYCKLETYSTKRAHIHIRMHLVFTGIMSQWTIVSRVIAFCVILNPSLLVMSHYVFPCLSMYHKDCHFHRIHTIEGSLGDDLSFPSCLPQVLGTQPVSYVFEQVRFSSRKHVPVSFFFSIRNFLTAEVFLNQKACVIIQLDTR
jgi:hypothetical protein